MPASLFTLPAVVGRVIPPNFMTLAGLIFMLLSVGSVTVLFIWCVVRVLRGGRNEDHMAHVEPIETEDLPRR